MFGNSIFRFVDLPCVFAFIRFSASLTIKRILSKSASDNSPIDDIAIAKKTEKKDGFHQVSPKNTYSI